MSQFDEDSLALHAEQHGKISIQSKISLRDKGDLSVAYTPGVAAVSRAIASDSARLYDYTPKGNMVAVVSDGSAVLGLGNVGAAAAYPVMEGKSLLFKEFADVEAFPLVVKTQDTDAIVDLICNISDGFGGVNLEDIAAPRCFEIERKLKERLNIPVFHDDQHGTAIVVLAGLLNALQVVGKLKQEVRVVINGAGAAGLAIAKLLEAYNETGKAGPFLMIVVDSVGAIYEGRPANMNAAKEAVAGFTNRGKRMGDLAEVMHNADVFIGVSKAGLVTQDMVRQMADDAIVFAMANPDPEISEDAARAAGAAVVATGRSDSPNQLNNVLVFPGLFRGALDARIEQFNYEMFLAAAEALAALVSSPSAEKIIPSPFDAGVAESVAEAVRELAG